MLYIYILLCNIGEAIYIIMPVFYYNNNNKLNKYYERIIIIIVDIKKDRYIYDS